MCSSRILDDEDMRLHTRISQTAADGGRSRAALFLFILWFGITPLNIAAEEDIVSSIAADSTQASASVQPAAHAAYAPDKLKVRASLRN